MPLIALIKNPDLADMAVLIPSGIIEKAKAAPL
jgi:hypothetical protein